MSHRINPTNPPVAFAGYAEGFASYAELLEKRKIDISEEIEYINLMSLAANILKQPQNLINAYEQEILRIAEHKVKKRYGQV
jgi:hypothetical protein